MAAPSSTPQRMKKGGVGCFGGCFRPKNRTEELKATDIVKTGTRAVTPEELRSAVVVYQTALSQAEEKAGIQGDKLEASPDLKVEVSALKESLKSLPGKLAYATEKSVDDEPGKGHGDNDMVPDENAGDSHSSTPKEDGAICTSEQQIIHDDAQKLDEATQEEVTEEKPDCVAGGVAVSLGNTQLEADGSDATINAETETSTTHDAQSPEPVVRAALTATGDNEAPVRLQLTVNDIYEVPNAAPRPLNGFGRFLSGVCKGFPFMLNCASDDIDP